MPCIQKASINFVYDIKGRKVTLDKNLVDNYSETVCPVDDEYMEIMVDTFGKEKEDDVMSYSIAASMARELYEYRI